MPTFEPGEPEILDEGRVIGLLSGVADSYRQQVTGVMRQYAEELANEFIEGLQGKIQQQTLQHKKLSPAYAEYKKRNKLDPRTLIATGEYLNSFVAEEMDDEAGVVKFRCGVQGGIHSRSGLSFNRLAKIHEYGRGKVPARPHWRPQALEFRLRGQEIARELRSRVARAVASGI